MDRKLNVVLGAIALAGCALAAGRAGAQDLPAIQTPSQNIFCIASPASSGQPTPELRCDIKQMTDRAPPAPANCPGAYGDAFFIDPTGPGKLECHGDTAINPSDPVLAYGATWTVYGFSCLSQTTGLTCRNSQGHGFSISREAQKVF